MPLDAASARPCSHAVQRPVPLPRQELHARQPAQRPQRDPDRAAERGHRDGALEAAAGAVDVVLAQLQPAPAHGDPLGLGAVATLAARASYASDASTGWPDMDSPSPRMAAASIPAGESPPARAMRPVGPFDELLAAAAHERVQHVALGDQRRGIRVALEVHDVPRAAQPHLRFGRPAADDGQVGQDGVAQRCLAQTLDGGHQRGRAHAVARRDERVDRAGEPLVAQQRVGGEPAGIAEQFRRLRPRPLRATLAGQPVDLVGEHGVRGGRRRDPVGDPADRIGDDLRRAAMGFAGGAHTHEADHGRPGQRIAQPRLELRTAGQQPRRGGLVDRSQRVVEPGQLRGLAEGLRPRRGSRAPRPARGRRARTASAGDPPPPPRARAPAAGSRVATTPTAGSSSRSASTSRGLPRVCRVRTSAIAGCRTRPRSVASSATAAASSPSRRSSPETMSPQQRMTRASCRAPRAAAGRGGGGRPWPARAGRAGSACSASSTTTRVGSAPADPVHEMRGRRDGLGGHVLLQQLPQHAPGTSASQAAALRPHAREPPRRVVGEPRSSTLLPMPGLADDRDDMPAPRVAVAAQRRAKLGQFPIAPDARRGHDDHRHIVDADGRRTSPVWRRRHSGHWPSPGPATAARSR